MTSGTTGTSTTTSSTSTAVVTPLVEFDSANYTVNESDEMVAVKLKISAPPTNAVTGEVRPGKAASVTSGHMAASAKTDYFTKLPSTSGYPTFTFPAGSTALVTVNIPIQRNLIAHSEDFDFTVHAHITSATGKGVVKLGTQKSAIVSIHQDQASASF